MERKRITRSKDAYRRLDWAESRPLPDLPHIPSAQSRPSPPPEIKAPVKAVRMELDLLATLIGLLLLFAGAMWLALWVNLCPVGGVLTTVAGAVLLLVLLGKRERGGWSGSNSGWPSP